MRRTYRSLVRWCVEMCATTQFLHRLNLIPYLPELFSTTRSLSLILPQESSASRAGRLRSVGMFAGGVLGTKALWDDGRQRTGTRPAAR
jgi:hypothetical protein